MHEHCGRGKNKQKACCANSDKNKATDCKNNLNDNTNLDYSVLLIGNPNVGKSLLFQRLTGHYATVSNYPGTTVDITSGTMSVGDHHKIHVTDTPGLYNLLTVTEEEAVAKEMLLSRDYDAIVNVLDAKNIARMMPLTLQLIEANLPVIVVLNMYDELAFTGQEIQITHLEHDLGVPVIGTSAAKKTGIENLKSAILSMSEGRYNKRPLMVKYPEVIEERIQQISSMLEYQYPISARALSLLLLQNDKVSFDMIKEEPAVSNIQAMCKQGDTSALRISIAHARNVKSEEIILENLQQVGEPKSRPFQDKLESLTLNPWFGLFSSLLVLYFGFYLFVGQFGAGVMVGFFEETIFQGYITPVVNSFFGRLFGDGIFFSLFAGDYGIVTLGVRYALAIVLPVVFSFFLLFSILEDSGYLPRLSMVLDRFFKKIGLSGRSVIPLVLGLGCGTMATVVTRTLETKRERLIVTFLLALSVPCAAQLGVILAVLGVSFYALLIWVSVLVIIFTIAGRILDKYLSGTRPVFFIELPPLRLPKIQNVLYKTFHRMKWYAIEVIPIFIYASAIIWVGKLIGLFDILTKILAIPASWAGLPSSMGEIFLYGFFRRDFGAAGLFDLQATLTIRQSIVACVILTLFIPCIAQFSVMIKERGAKTAFAIFAFIIPFAFFVGILLNKILLVGGMA